MTFSPLATLLVVLLPVAHQDTDEDVPLTDADRAILKMAGKIEENVAELRGLPFRHEVTKHITTVEKIGDFMRERLQDAAIVEDIREEEELLTAVGLIPADLDYQEFVGDMLQAGVGGYYDWETRSLHCLSGGLMVLNRYVMVHETYHALQDQHFDLEAFVMNTDLSLDESLARSALVEGEAESFTAKYLEQYSRENQEDLGEAELQDYGGAIEQQLRAMTIPPFFREMMTWPYITGRVFVDRVYEEGGWDRVGAAYAAPPVSSEQVIHPDKFLRGDDPPVVVELELPASLSRRGYQEACRKVLGELSVQLMIRHLAYDAVHAMRGSAGWGGDRAVVLRDPAGDRLLLWKTVWDTERDARQFHTAWRRAMLKQLQMTGPLERAEEVQVTDQEQDGIATSALSRPDLPASWILRRDRTVVVMRGELLKTEQDLSLAIEILDH